MSMRTMYDVLLGLEKDLFRYEKITDKKWLDSTLHDRFKEMGSSGSIFGKNDTIEALSASKSDRDIDIYNFECEALNEDCWIVHYMTKADDQLFYRTSIWIRENGLKLIFHQSCRSLRIEHAWKKDDIYISKKGEERYGI